MSNIVIDGDDKAKIIDINRRGCPVGWEPPEVAALIESKQRIAMYIGVKSDIFQLGMVLWAIAMQQDEPDIQTRPLTLHSAPEEIPSYYRDLVHICLSDDPKHRRNTTYLLDLFPELDEGPQLAPDDRDLEAGQHQYIDPATAVNREDIERFRRLVAPFAEHPNMDIISTGSHTYVNPPTDISGEAYFFPTRGRSPTRLPVDKMEHRPPSHVSPLDAGRDADAGDLASPDGQPIVVDVSPERHYLSREEPFTIDVPEVDGVSGGVIGADDDVSIDLNDAARASLEEYRHRHEGLVGGLEPADLLTNQVYQPPVEPFDLTKSQPDECAYATLPGSVASNDSDAQQSYTDMVETTYFNPIMAVHSHRESVGSEIVRLAPHEVEELTIPLIQANEQASMLDNGSEMPQQCESDKLRFVDIVDGELVPVEAAFTPAVDGMETQRHTQQAHDDAVHAPSVAEAAKISAVTNPEQAHQEGHKETLSSDWIREAATELRDSIMEQTQIDELTPSLPHDFIANSETAPAHATEDVLDVINVKPPAEQLRTFPANVQEDINTTEPTVFSADSENDEKFRLVDGRVDSGFASHHDQGSPTRRKMGELRACGRTETEGSWLTD